MFEIDQQMDKKWTHVARPQDGRGRHGVTSRQHNTEPLRVQLEQDGRKYLAEGHNNTTNVSTREQIT